MDATVVIADDHGLVRRGTREILEQDPGLSVVGEAADGVEALQVVGEVQPDVVILDIGMPEMNGVEATRHIHARWPDIGILVLTVHDDAEYVWRAIQAGAAGFLRKDVSDEELVAAVRTIAEGGNVLDSGLTTTVIERLRQPTESDSDPAVDLTPRELEVLRHVARGSSNRLIAATLGMSPRTVEVHLHRIFKKMQVSSRTEAVVLGARRGLIELDSNG